MVSPWFARLPEIAAFEQGGKSQFRINGCLHIWRIFSLKSQAAEIEWILEILPDIAAL
ncbi:hypothetical protein [Thalassospira lucentensis]|uniref:hypothetical protein n=1 Tax=Thalassospira lucentensis TaxID=168935 RepID=UPI00294363CD|nr:hypothetical protein [Thalassospira lucentensis]WOI12281.1 hypothetical protein R1T41_06755 [Thalassospira lucentensis]